MKRPALVGIINVTPDSFSSDGRDPIAAVAAAKQMMLDGADILDIGAESTRPGATALSAEEEWARLAPVLKAIAAADWRSRVRLSIDTRHAQTAARALAMGVDIINDVSGLTDAMMCEVLAGHACDVVVMHSLTIPADAQVLLPETCDVVAELLDWKKKINSRAVAFGIAQERLIYDVGIGFGKSAKQSLALMLAADTLHQSGGRWLFGHSRKSFLKLFSQALPEARDDLTLAFSAQLAAMGADYLRVHNVARHRALFEQLCT